MRALFLGRFQPFHLGHFKMIEYLLLHYEKVIVVIGSSQECLTKQNPFTANERKTMISLCFPTESKIQIVPLTDVSSDEFWVHHVLSNVPEFDIVYSNNSLVQRLFTEKGIKIKELLFERHLYEGEKIRNLIKENKGFELLPLAVADYLKKINAQERLRNIK